MTLDIELRLHDTWCDFARTLEIANEETSEVVELGGHIGVLGTVTHVSPHRPRSQSPLHFDVRNI